MAGNNPVFSRIEKQLKQDQYAGFGQPQQQAPQQPYGQQPYGQQPYGYTPPTQDTMTPQQLQDMYAAPPAGPLQTGRVTFDDVIMKTLGLFALVLVTAAASWVTTASSPGLTMPFWIAGMVGGLIVGLVIAFKKTISVPLIVGYALLEGVFVGAFSRVMERAYPGLVATAVLATLCTFAGMFLGYKSGLIKVTSKSRRIFGFALMGYVLFSLVNVIALFAGWTTGWGFGGSGMLGIAISVLGVGLASYSLAVDFDTIGSAVRMGAPQKYSWLLAHGLIVSLVWLYIEIVRLLARLRD
ncbi:MAG: Bax inhibitor-1/YccA family protein [Dermatophilaceae bacterium]|nr:Bax inhibitor-1/YccA family protein [Dermatophilaceae bacterium]MBP9917592.1 Bax inhibitor-1/YccA family protein [Dermatophilaceae bacterium]